MHQCDQKRIRFRTARLNSIFFRECDRLILIGRAITTARMYDQELGALAYVDERGRIMRFHRQIGTTDEIEVIRDWNEVH